MGNGLTVEEVDAMQDEMNKIGDEGDPAKAAADAEAAKVAEDAAKLAEAKAAEDAAKAKAEADAKAGAEGGKAKEDEDVDLVRELKEQVRQSNDALKKVTGDYQKLHKIMVDKGLLTEEELKANEAEELAAKEAFNARQQKLNEMLAIMELNPTFADVREVCSQSNFDDLIDAFSRFYVKENGGDLQEIAMKIEGEVWAEINPYKKMYDLIKKFHPKYAAKDTAKDETKAAEEKAKAIAAEADKTKKAVEANPSAASIGAGGAGAGATGWTAARIDAMAEDELHTVPKDIYDKYLKGLLT